MIKRLKNHWLLLDGTVFRYWRAVPESILLTGHGRVWLHNWKGLLRLWAQSEWVRLPAGPVYLRVHNSYSGYYHWLVESLPRLLEARQQLPAFTLLLPKAYQAPFYEATLRLLGVASVQRLQARHLYGVPDLALPYAPEGMGSYDPAKLQQVKAALLAAVPAPTGPPRRLYISRRRAARRKVLNEAAVERVLVGYGFESVCFEDYSFEEQLQLCAGAEALVGIHGAGLTNMLFLPAGAVVVELRKHDNGQNYFFTSLAAALGHRYELLYCPAADERQSVQDANLEVDPAALAEALRRSGLGISVGSHA